MTDSILSGKSHTLKNARSKQGKTEGCETQVEEKNLMKHSSEGKKGWTYTLANSKRATWKGSWNAFENIQMTGQILGFVSFGEFFFMCLACWWCVALCVMRIDRLHYFPTASLTSLCGYSEAIHFLQNQSHDLYLKAYFRFSIIS